MSTRFCVRRPSALNTAASDGGKSVTVNSGEFMATNWVHSTETVNWDEMSELYRIAPLGIKSADWLKTTYTNSMFKCIAFDGERIVAAGRAVADGADCSYLCDIVVHPEHQGSGLG